jgi:hypothetical protein
MYATRHSAARPSDKIGGQDRRSFSKIADQIDCLVAALRRKSLSLSHAPCRNRTYNPVIKSYMVQGALVFI